MKHTKDFCGSAVPKIYEEVRDSFLQLLLIQNNDALMSAHDGKPLREKNSQGQKQDLG